MHAQSGDKNGCANKHDRPTAKTVYFRAEVYTYSRHNPLANGAGQSKVGSRPPQLRQHGLHKGA